MERKILNTFFIAALLALSCASAYADNQSFDKPLSSPYVLQPSTYFGVGYSYARIQNAGVRNFDISSANTITHKNRYGAGTGFYVKGGQLLTKNWGYELNAANLYSETTATNYIFPVGTLKAKGTTLATEALAIYTAPNVFTPNLNFYAKIGLGYEQQKITYHATGTTENVPFDVTTTNTTKSIGLAGAFEARYQIMQHLALSFEINELAAKQNVVMGNVGIIGNF